MSMIDPYYLLSFIFLLDFPHCIFLLFADTFCVHILEFTKLLNSSDLRIKPFIEKIDALKINFSFSRQWQKDIIEIHKIIKIHKQNLPQ